MKKIAENEQFQMGNDIFTYTIVNGQYKIVKEAGKKPKPAFVPPTLQEVKDFFKSEGYTDEIATQAFNHYKHGNWHDSRGNPVKNWKQKMSNNWFKSEHKIKPEYKTKEDSGFMF